MPAYRLAASAAAVSLLAAALGTPAYATGGTTGRGGASTAAVLRAGLDVSLLNKSVRVPLDSTLNAVKAPADADKTALTVTLNGVDHGRPVNIARATAATARATADKRTAEGYANLTHATVHVPGLRTLPLVELDGVTSKAVCAAGKRPTAASNLGGSVTVLGKRVTVTTGGTTNVKVPGVGTVRLDLSRTSTTSRTAAAAALDLKIEVNPLKLNVAEVSGRVTLAEATCRSPKAAGGGTPADPSPSRPGTDPQGAGGSAPQNLAETGGSSATPYLAAGAGLFITLGTGAFVLARHRRRSGG